MFYLAYSLYNTILQLFVLLLYLSLSLNVIHYIQTSLNFLIYDYCNHIHLLDYIHMLANPNRTLFLYFLKILSYLLFLVYMNCLVSTIILYNIHFLIIMFLLHRLYLFHCLQFYLIVLFYLFANHMISYSLILYLVLLQFPMLHHNLLLHNINFFVLHLCYHLHHV